MKQREKTEYSEQSLSNLQNNIKLSNILVIGIPEMGEGEQREKNLRSNV